jgi:hypothetical protein
MTEDLVETVEVALVLDEAGAREVVEVLDTPAGQVRFKCLKQNEIFLEGYWYFG